VPLSAGVNLRGRTTSKPRPFSRIPQEKPGWSIPAMRSESTDATPDGVEISTPSKLVSPERIVGLR
jgi:hypothetical protein